MPFVYATPPAPPVVPVSPWQRTRHEWIGWDGSVWELSDWRSGVFLTQEGVEGLSRPQHTDWTAPLSPFLHGQQHTGHVVNARRVFWPVYLFSDEGSIGWRDRDRDFWRTMHPDMPGIWRVTTGSLTRELSCRFQDDGGHSYDRDPLRFGWARYGISLVADDPFWTGPAVSQSWKDEPPTNFFGASGKAPLFHIMSGSRLANATMNNPGDVEAWPVWEVRGPADNVHLGVSGQVVSFPHPIAEGSTLTINSDPTDQTAWLDGEDVTDMLGDYDFAPIPPESPALLSLAVSGTGIVKATIVPRFYRAW